LERGCGAADNGRKREADKFEMKLRRSGVATKTWLSLRLFSRVGKGSYSSFQKIDGMISPRVLRIRGKPYYFIPAMAGSVGNLKEKVDGSKKICGKAAILIAWQSDS